MDWRFKSEGYKSTRRKMRKVFKNVILSCVYVYRGGEDLKVKNEDYKSTRRKWEKFLRM